MAETTGTRGAQIKAIDLHGTDAKVQKSDGTGELGHVAVYNANGSITDGGGIPLISSPPGSGSGGGTTLAPGTWYGQVPRGRKNGSNTTFYLDYSLASPYTILVVNGVAQKPAVDGPGSNADPEYSITDDVVTMTHAPKSGDWLYIWYFIDQIAPPPPIVASATITFISTYTPSAEADGVVRLSNSTYPFIFYDNGSGVGWTDRTATFDLTPIPAGFGDGEWQMLLDLEQSLMLNGTDTLHVFEIYADVTLSDGTTSRIYPTASAFRGDVSLFNPNTSWLKLTSVTGDGATATYSYEVSAGPGSFSVGDLARIEGFTDAGFNVTSPITAIGSGTFSIANATTGSETIDAAGYVDDGTWYGQVADAGSSIDGDLATYATLIRDHYWPGHQGGGIIYTF